MTQKSDGTKLHLRQSISQHAPESTHLPHLLLAGQRAGTSIQLMATPDCGLELHIEGNSDLTKKNLANFLLQIGPPSAVLGASFQAPARIDIDSTTRTVSFYLGDFSDSGPTEYPIVVKLPVPDALGKPQQMMFGTMINWPELTIQDFKNLEAANELVRETGCRIAFITEKDNQVIGTTEHIQLEGLFNLGAYERNVRRAFQKIDLACPAPIVLGPSILEEIANMSPENRATRWQEVRNIDSSERPRVSSVFLRLATSDGRPYEETFMTFLSLNFFPTPQIGDNPVLTQEELRRQWKEAKNDFKLQSYFKQDIYQLAELIRTWSRDPDQKFPLQMTGKTTPEPIMRSVMTIRFLPIRDRVWHFDRPVIFEFRPVNRREAYKMEADYWRGKGDERRAQLAQEISDRENPPSGPA